MGKILIIGNGYIGNRMAGELDCEVSSRMLHTLDECLDEITRRKPKTLINCIGFTGANNVDDCEREKDLTMQANVFVPLLMAEACARTGTRFVHLSSGCIFNYTYGKQRPIKETLVPDYYDLFYSRTKVYAERAVEYLSRRYPMLIARLRIPLDNRPSRKNIIDKLIRYGKVIDIPNSVTYLPDFFKAVKHLIKVDARGIYNVVNKGGLRYPELMEAYKRHVPEFSYSVLPMKELKIKRTNLLLSTKKLEQTGFKVRDIHDVLDECVREYLKNSTRT